MVYFFVKGDSTSPQHSDDHPRYLVDVPGNDVSKGPKDAPNPAHMHKNICVGKIWAFQIHLSSSQKVICHQEEQEEQAGGLHRHERNELL